MLHALSAHELLEAWERGRGRPLAQRALGFLTAACRGVSYEDLSELTVGQRDALLFSLRRQTFGSDIKCRASCPNCGEALELNFDMADLPLPRLPATTGERQFAEPATYALGEYTVCFRLPNAADLVAASEAHDVAEARQTILRRCCGQCLRNGEPAVVDELPEAVIEALSQRLAAADPLADLQLAMSCPACQEAWKTSFDIVAFFCGELEQWARRVLWEVHVLAAAHGWSEQDILRMSPWRRQAYLETVGQ